MELNYSSIPKLQWLSWRLGMDKSLHPTLYKWCNYLSMLVLKLTHWGRVTHICVSRLTTIGSDNGLAPTILLIWMLGTKFSEILSEIHTFSFKKMPLKMSSGKCRPFCLGLNVLNHVSKRVPWKPLQALFFCSCMPSCYSFDEICIYIYIIYIFVVVTWFKARMAW